MAKILLVEDDKNLREIYGVRLQAEGYEIVSAGDGEEALALAIKERPNLIISDVMMPKISGFDMLDILRSTTETKDVKVIMMTALSSDDQRARGESLGADRYLVKSQVGIEDVVRTVHDVLADGAAPATPAPTPAPAATAAATPAPPTPAAAPTPTITPAAPAPTTGPVLPQPTAPFSSPAPSSLGSQLIQPLSGPPSPVPADTVTASPSTDLDFSARLAAELGTEGPAAVPTPTTPTAATVPLTPAPTTIPTPTMTPTPVAPVQTIEPVLPPSSNAPVQPPSAPQPPASV